MYQIHCVKCKRMCYTPKVPTQYVVENYLCSKCGTMPEQIPLPFPKCVTNAPSRTFKAKVAKGTVIDEAVNQLYDWLNDPLQTEYNRVEFKFNKTYIVLAKLKEGEVEDGKD